MLTPIILATAFFATSLASAFTALVIMSFLAEARRKKHVSPTALMPEIEPTVFLFEDRDLVDATPSARALLQTVADYETDWDKLVAYITPKLPEFAKTASALGDLGATALTSTVDPNFRLQIENLGNVTRLTLCDISAEGQCVVIDGLSLHAQEDEIASLREILGRLPVPVWRCGEDGVVVWANKTYLNLAQEAAGEEDLVWPLPVLFDFAGYFAGNKMKSTGSRRMKLPAADARGDQWFDCHAIPSGSGLLHFAMPADSIVRAENSLREFIQTLSKTFADLPIGLAIFDRQRQLALFNPAMIDLTALGPEFLSARPTLFSFLDQLREARIAPEPKDYTGWRQRMADLEKAASSGHYEEVWSLPTGQTYKVTGRPHPDGALALLIEDTTAETSLTRRFRSEIELGQRVIDALDDAVVVFSSAGELVMSNTAYTTLWGLDPIATLGCTSIRDATRQWQDLAKPTPIWGDLRDFVGDMSERTEWDADVTLTNGSILACQIAPMAGGATLVRFTKARPERLHVSRARRARHTPSSSDADALIEA
ncbi:MAG: PAS-domain containing protein [Albidovulum sp.]